MISSYGGLVNNMPKYAFVFMIFTLAALGLQQSDFDDIPVYCPQKLGRKAKESWDSSDLRICTPFEGVDVEDNSVSGIPHFEANIFTQMILSNSLDYSFNFFKKVFTPFYICL